MDRKRIFEIGYIFTLPVIVALWITIAFTTFSLWGIYMLIGAIVLSIFLLVITSGDSEPCEIEGCERDAVRLERFCRPCRIQMLTK